MVFWGIIAIGVIGGLILIMQGDKSKGLGFTMWLLLGPILIGVVVAFVFAWFLGELFPGEPTSYNAPDPPARILNLEDNKETHLDGNGAFVLVAGGFSLHEDTEQTYSFYQETSDGSYFLHTISADYNTHIRIHFISGNETPRAVRKQPTPHWVTPAWISPIDLSGDNVEDEADETWTIYVPKGTITTVDQFRLDSK